MRRDWLTRLKEETCGNTKGSKISAKVIYFLTIKLKNTSKDLNHNVVSDRVNRRTWCQSIPGGALPKKFGRGVRPAFQNSHPTYEQNGGKMAKIDTLFMTKTVEIPYPLGPHIPIYPI